MAKKKDLSGWYKFEIQENLKHYYFDRANDSDTKTKILKMVENTYNQLECRGDRCFTLLYFDLAREGLKKMRFGAKENDFRDFLQVINEHIERWDNDATFRKARVLVECL